jgi:hypothetical protein
LLIKWYLMLANDRYIPLHSNNEYIPKHRRDNPQTWQKGSQNLQAAPAQLSNKHGGGTSH